MEECDNDEHHFLDVVLDNKAFWTDVANIIQTDEVRFKDERFWVCSCEDRNVHSKRQRDNCPLCEAKQHKSRDAYQVETRQERMFTDRDWRDFSCLSGIHWFGEDMDASCGAHICEWCGWHKSLVRCFCGWAASGGDGAAELVALGENID